MIPSQTSPAGLINADQVAGRTLVEGDADSSCSLLRAGYGIRGRSLLRPGNGIPVATLG
jgi:hypothetical protein